MDDGRWLLSSIVHRLFRYNSTSNLIGGKMATYRIEPERSTLHGHFSRDLPPVLTIEPGDTVVYSTLDAGWGLEAATALDAPRRHFEPRVEELDGGHALCGPVAIRGAEPGMTLEC